MKYNFKRLMGILLAILMVVTMLPVTAFADHTTEGAPNVFSVATSDSGDYMQTEFLLIETLTQNSQTYYGLMLRRGINSYYGAGTIKIPEIHNLDLVDDTAQTSTEAVKYMTFVLRKVINDNGSNKGINGENMNSLVDKLYPDEIKPYIATLEHKVTDFGGVTYKTVDNITIPTWEQLTANKDYVALYQNGTGDGVSWSGTWTRDKHTGYQPSYKWLKAMNSSGGTSYGQLGSSYDYYFLMPVIYVTDDFFENVKIDTTKEVGADIKALLADKYYQRDLKHLGYTEGDFAKLTVPLQPDVLTPEWSPNYVKTADGSLELLYNETKVVNGETYISFTVAEDYAGKTARMGAGFQKVTTDSAGNTIPDETKYGQYKFLTTNPVTYGDSIDVVTNDLPQGIQDNLYLNTWTAGSTYWLGVRSGEGPAKSISYISMPSGTEMANHGAYLATQMTDNANPWANGTHKTAIVRDPITHSCNVYDPAQGKVIDSGLSSAYAWGSVFPTFYVNVDFMKSVKLDVETMSDTVKALFPANFVRSDLSAIYTEAELDELGVQSYTADTKPSTEGSTFVAGGKTFYYLNNTIDYKGKEYFRIFDKMDWTTWSGDAFYPITERDEGGIYVGLKQGSLTGSDLQNHNTNLGVFGDYKIPSDYEWSYGTAMYNGSSTDVYLKGSINVPTPSDYTYVINQGVSFVAQGQQRITSSFFIYNNGTNRHGFNGNQQGNGALIYTADGNYFKGEYAAGYNYVTYISEDYFLNNELDVSTTGEVMLNAIKANFTRAELAAGGWSAAALDALFDSDYTGNGLGLIAYKTDSGVSVVINNNGTEPAGSGSVLVVAAYSADGLEAAQIVNMTGNIPANSYTSKIPVALNIADGVEVTEIKVMLWDSIDNIKPLAQVVSAQ